MHSLSDLVRKAQPAPPDPVLVLSDPEAEEDFPLDQTTRFTEGRAGAPGDPVVLSLQKARTRAAKIVPGITIGRHDENDVRILAPSVSRFHACIFEEPRVQKWQVIDLGSSLGTWVEGRRLAPKQAASITDGMHLRFGAIEATFYTAAGFARYLKQLRSS